MSGRVSVLVVVSVLGVAACGDNRGGGGGGDGGAVDAGEEPTVLRVQARGAVERLASMYTQGLGLYGFRWWNSANALEAVIDYSVLSGDDEFAWHAPNTFEVNEEGEFINELYDDEGWWALTWMKAYDMTGDARYLAMSEVIFEDIAGGWDDECGGGVWWSKDRDYKNAITNELFLTIAARLYVRTEKAEYLDWAEQEWAWFEASGMLNGDGLINDGLDDACANNGQTTWTYNQGVVLGGLVALAEANGDESLVEVAEAIADAAIAAELLVGEDGVLVEPCEPDCGGDGPQFKGVFMRNLSALRVALEERGDKYEGFIARQAESIREHATSEFDEIGLMWAGPFDEPDVARQGAGMDAINAALALELAAE
ncbi:MAG TPA: glycoside hydrolase family 76 protein [Kofleriaceae bacterium]|nr:glycoside hydrolase family 76 protein [Kofleriaceae bacterium]